MFWFLNILNPKLTIFFLAFLPQFVTPNSASPLSQLLLQSGVFIVVTFAVFVVYGLLAHTYRTTVIESEPIQAWLHRSFSAAFVGLGVHLAFSEE